MSTEGPASQPSTPDLQKKLARERRERRLRRFMVAMSWTTPVLAFGGFFTIWHQVSTAVTTHSGTSSVTAGTTGASTTATSDSPIVLSVGSTGQNVEILQYALAQLGYFHHSLTTYYGTVTARAVMAFQQANHLPATGQLDEQTLNALQAVLNQMSGRGGDDDGGYGDDGGSYGGSGGSYGGTYGGSSGSGSGGSYFGSGSSGSGSSSGGAVVSPPSTQPSVSSGAS